MMIGILVRKDRGLNMRWFNKNKEKAAIDNLLKVLEETKKELETANNNIIALDKAVKEKDIKIKELSNNISDNKYARIYSLLGGDKGRLFHDLVIRHQLGYEVEFNNICCTDMYLADRHSTIYELVNRIYINDIAIMSSHFEKACFDNVTFRNVEFTDNCFYKAVFEDVNFINCKFINCDFTSARGYNLVFENCTEQDTDLSKIEIEISNETDEYDLDFDEDTLFNDEELEV